MTDNAVKIIKQTETSATVGGYGVIYGGIDLEGETFTADTDYMLDLVPKKPVMYDHGQQKNVSEFLGSIANEDIKADDVGLWIQAELDRSKDYVDGVLKLIEEGVLGWSSGTIGHLARRNEGKILRWPVVEFSLTPTPAEPRTLGVERIKSLAEVYPDLEAFIPEAGNPETAKDSGSEPVTDDATDKEGYTPTIKTKEPVMDEEKVVQEKEAPVENYVTQEEHGELTANFKTMSDKLDALLEIINSQPKLKDAKYIAPDSETDHKDTKSFADFLIAIKNKNVKRLDGVYKALSEGVGTAGGYLVPQEFEARLMSFAQEAAVIRPRATVIPVMSNSGTVPALDQTAAPTAGVGQSAFAGGVRAYWTAEAGSITSTDPTFEMVQWEINKVAGYTKVSNELIADSAVGLEAIITSLFGKAVAAVEDYAFLRGTGAGMPLGIIASPCAIGVTTTTNNQFAIDDAAKMLGRFWPTPGGNPVWILNRALIPDLEAYFGVNVAGEDLAQPRKAFPVNIFGYPILYSEHMPAADTDDALLADLAAYLIFDRQGMQIAYSEHNAFLTDEGVWRFTKRLDGQPWLSAAITLADPGGATTVSPFVYHDD